MSCEVPDAALEPITLGRVEGEAETWLGRLCRYDAWLLLLCERDVEQDRALSRQLLELMDEYADKERELARANRDLQRQRRKAEHLMVTDPLTGMPNRLYFDRILEKECARALREGTGLGLLVIDIDHFKAINDTFGHEYGDRVLSMLGEVLSKGIRDADFAARWGGEEFAILTSPARQLQHWCHHLPDR